MEHADDFQLTDALHAEQGKGDPFAAAVRATRMPMIIADPRQDDCPIVFANDAFMTLTGYERPEILGRNCRFLQGAATNQDDVRRLREALAARTDVNVELLNYCKDGSTFWNALYMSPVFSGTGELQFFFASQFDVTDRRLREIETAEAKDFFEAAVRERTAELEATLAQKTMLLHEVDHRVKNNLQMVAAMIRSQARFSDSPEVKDALGTTMARVETLGTVHRRLYESADIARFDVAQFVREIAVDLVEAAGRPEIGVCFDLEDIVVPSSVASPLALLVNELITNALKHAFPLAGHPGTIRIATRTGEGRTEIVVGDDGVGMGMGRPAAGRSTFGHRLIESLVRQMRGALSFEDAQPGTLARVTFPPQPGR